MHLLVHGEGRLKVIGGDCRATAGQERRNTNDALLIGRSDTERREGGLLGRLLIDRLDRSSTEAGLRHREYVRGCVNVFLKEHCFSLTELENVCPFVLYRLAGFLRPTN